MTRALIIGDEQKQAAERVCAWAEEHRFTLAMLQEIIGGMPPPVGDDPQFAVHFPVGFRVVFSIDEMLHNKGWVRHISVSVDGTKWPHPAAVEEIMPLFGFRSGLADCYIYQEGETHMMHAINVVEKCEEAAGMTCPTCQHTMQLTASSPPIWWCSNCGTIRSKDVIPEHETPALTQIIPGWRTVASSARLPPWPFSWSSTTKSAAGASRKASSSACRKRRPCPTW